MRRKAFWALLGLLLAIQLIPYGRAHTNPPVVNEPAWPPGIRDLARAACFDCHSNETHWPFYAYVAPSSWLVQNDVDGGRRHLNFSEWQRPQKNAPRAAEEVRSGGMPLWYYKPLHPASRLSAADRERLAQAFEKMFGSEPR